MSGLPPLSSSSSSSYSSSCSNAAVRKPETETGTVAVAGTVAETGTVAVAETGAGAVAETGAGALVAWDRVLWRLSRIRSSRAEPLTGTADALVRITGRLDALVQSNGPYTQQNPWTVVRRP